MVDELQLFDDCVGSVGQQLTAQLCCTAQSGRSIYDLPLYLPFQHVDEEPWLSSNFAESCPLT